MLNIIYHTFSRRMWYCCSNYTKTSRCCWSNRCSWWTRTGWWNWSCWWDRSCKWSRTSWCRGRSKSCSCSWSRSYFISRSRGWNRAEKVVAEVGNDTMSNNRTKLIELIPVEERLTGDSSLLVEALDSSAKKNNFPFVPFSQSCLSSFTFQLLFIIVIYTTLALVYICTFSNGQTINPKK